MSNFTTASGRQAIDVAEAREIARMVRTNDPNMLSTDDMQGLLGHSAIVLDGQRRRPRYFDGRFLTGADLTRDQDYIRQRQADLARATGTGVVVGLQVSLGGGSGSQTLVIQPGHGVTPSGDLVLVTSRRAIPLLDLAASRRLDATFGLNLEPRAPLGRRSGLFLLALRPVEFSANPIAAYPTTINGPRQIEDGDIIEATAIDLIPYPDTGGAGSLDEARRAVARQLFLGHAHGLPQNALPLAVVALERGSVRWIDVALVRRETGADTPLQVSMGSRPRAVAEAFVLQHRKHLADVLSDRAHGGLSPSFAAAQYFAALPAAGQLPAAAILPDNLGFRQTWFPPAVDVDISFVPSDEVAALVEESLTLPPIDLLGDPADLDATGIIVLAPVTRQRLQRFEAALASLESRALADVAQGIRRPPAALLALLSERRIKSIEASGRNLDATVRAEQARHETEQWHTAWAEAVAAIPLDPTGTPLVWYVRRRAVAYESRMIGLAVAASGEDEALKNAVDKRLVALQLNDEMAIIAGRSTPLATARIYALLGGPRLADSTILAVSAIKDLTAALPAAQNGGIGVGLPGGLTRTGPLVPPGSIGGLQPRPGGGLLGGGVFNPDLLATRGGLTRLTLNRQLLRPGERQDLLSEGDVIDIASDYGDPNLGDGIEAIKAALDGGLPDKGQLWLGGTGQAIDLDVAARRLAGASLTKFARSVADLAAKANDDAAKALTTLIATAGTS